MPLITLLVAKLQTDFPDFHFISNGEFRWSPRERTIFYDADSEDLPSLLHELSHAILLHKEYLRDITLIKIEREAWSYAEHILAPMYDIPITIEQIEDSLDTYRDWLHARSTCPHCTATGVQIKRNEYKCLACTDKWRVNDARACTLRRYIRA